MGRELLLGCIADDFTGAGDAASFLAAAGMRTLLLNGVPKGEPEAEYEAAVIALKTRNEGRETAVADSLEAVRWLKNHGAKQYYSKYCSTFDSTPEGNIGPILDAFLEVLGEKFSVLCPALPVNGRTVKDGILYVNGTPLHESHMKSHPLNPMWASDLEELMKPQSKYPCMKLGAELLRKNREEIREELGRFGDGKEHFYIIPDYYEDGHAERIVELFGDGKILSGGSGILTALGRSCLKGRGTVQKEETRSATGAVVLAGSCSTATLSQIETFRGTGNYSYKIDPELLVNGRLDAAQIWREAVEQSAGREILIYSSDTPEEVKRVQRLGREKVAELLEQTMAKLAVTALREGRGRIIVAGGETSGAVTQALGFAAYLIGESIAPGVPVMIPVKNRQVRLILKSGNFGQPDFFMRALEQTRG